jgi:hypothetical protein
MGCLIKIDKVRIVAETACNTTSSRSHLIFKIHFHKKSLTLIDLAGSERSDNTNCKGDRLTEAKHINKSLSHLGDVLTSLKAGDSFVGYRNSKLTHHLQPILENKSVKVVMMINLNPVSVDESLCSLRFA